MKAIRKRDSYPLADGVVLTGVGAVCSLGNSIEETTQGLVSGKSGVTEIMDFDAGELGGLAAQVKNPPAVDTDIHPQLARTMGKHLLLLLAATAEALSRAGIGPGMFDPQDRGFFAGMGMVDYHVEDLLPAVIKSLDPGGDLDYDRFFPDGYREIYPLWPLGMLNNVVFCQASIQFDLRGENCVFSPHGDAGIQAVAEAVKVLEEGKAKVALAGGVSEEISPFSLARARLKGLIGPQAGAGLARDDKKRHPAGKADKPLSACRSATRNPQPETTEDIFLGEGGAMLVLEPLSSALGRGADILGGISGFGFSCERSEEDNSATRQAISTAIRGALSQASLDPGSIDLIMLGSLRQSELEAVREIFDTGGDAPLMVSTVKALGEMLAAGPILNAAIALSIPGLTSFPPDVQCPPAEGHKLRGHSYPRRILVNGISSEGRCASMIVQGGGETK